MQEISPKRRRPIVGKFLQQFSGGDGVNGEAALRSDLGWKCAGILATSAKAYPHAGIDAPEPNLLVLVGSDLGDGKSGPFRFWRFGHSSIQSFVRNTLKTATLSRPIVSRLTRVALNARPPGVTSLQALSFVRVVL
jgi:hypothetical protein